MRNAKGQFARKVFIRSGFIIAIGLLGTAVLADHWVGRELSAVVATPVYAGITMEAKVAMTKDELVESLAKQCETKSAAEPDATIILDTNNQMSIGAFQYQIKTVQQYEKQLYGKDISRVEAIKIAINHQEAAALTTDILFKVPGGWKNWLTCASNLDLPVQIDLLKKLEK